VVDGVVVNAYETGSGRRVVVRVTVPGASEDDEAMTVTLPADAVTPAEDAKDTSPGSWAPGAQYERMLQEALKRLAPTLHSQIKKLPTRSDTGADLFIVKAGKQRIIVQVKQQQSETKIPAAVVDELDNKRPSQDLVILLVSNQGLTRSAEDRVRATPSVRAVRWRGPHDDEQLAAALATALSDAEEQRQ
jgi:hypothetical protein